MQGLGAGSALCARDRTLCSSTLLPRTSLPHGRTAFWGDITHPHRLSQLYTSVEEQAHLSAASK
jgi:hypothetical protein